MFLAGSGIDEEGRRGGGKFFGEGFRGDEESFFLLVAGQDRLLDVFGIEVVLLADLGESIVFGEGAGLAAPDVEMGEERAAGGRVFGEEVSHGRIEHGGSIDPPRLKVQGGNGSF